MGIFFITLSTCSIQSVGRLKHPWQTCSFRHQLDFSWKHSSHAAITHEYYSLTFPPPSIARYSFMQQSELGCRGENENAQLNASRSHHDLTWHLDWRLDADSSVHQFKTKLNKSVIIICDLYTRLILTHICMLKPLDVWHHCVHVQFVCHLCTRRSVDLDCHDRKHIYAIELSGSSEHYLIVA